MKRLSAVFTLIALVALPFTVHAQEIQQQHLIQRSGTHETYPNGWQKFHLTQQLISSPEGQEALAEYQRRKAAGLLPYPRKRADAIGDIMTFKVSNWDTGQLDDIDFELKEIADRFQIWVEVAELANGTVTQDDIDNLREALGERTSPDSFDPNAGIIEIDETVFGIPPNVDGDSKTDVLWLDIRDGFTGEPGDLLVAGFFDPNDLTGRNMRDIIYMDTDPILTSPGSTIDDALQTAVHEYQHLIRATYNQNPESFTNEALSEWAEVLCGYTARSVRYLDDPSRYNVPILRFDRNAPIDDYQRGGLFINYIADRYGPLEAGKITREGRSGSVGLRNALIAMQAGISLEELIFDFHTANYLNDTSLDPRYGYTTQQRKGLRAMPSDRYDGRVDMETPVTRASLAQGGVQYLLWEQVKDFTLTLSPVMDAVNLRADAFLFGTNGSFQGTTTLNLSGSDNFEGEYGRVVVVVANVNPDGPLKNVDYSAQWAEPEVQVELLTTQYDTGRAEAPNDGNPFFTLSNSTDPGVATRFVVPSAANGTALDKVFIAPYFLSQFSNGGQPENAPRDLTLKVWATGPGGLPGEELFSQVLQDERSGNASLTLSFIEVDLSSVPELFILPDTIFVGYTNAGTDANSFVFATSLYDVEQVSLVSSNFTQGWGALWSIGSGDSMPYEGTVIPIRAQFAVPIATAVDDEAEVPAQIVLYPNFPNPFNPSTSVRYSLPRAAQVRLAVYDLLGREVTVLVDGMGAPGEYVVQVDARQWASGVYFYTLQTAAQTLTQRMVLVK